MEMKRKKRHGLLRLLFDNPIGHISHLCFRAPPIAAAVYSLGGFKFLACDLDNNSFA